MDDRARRDALLEKLRALEGADEDLFRRVSRELERAPRELGYDERGRLQVAFFDARSYDIASFDDLNRDRFDLHYFQAPLSLETVPFASGHRAVCIFVNDCADAAVLDALASLGVELLALRCAGYNNVDLAACRKLGLSVVRVPEYSPHAVAEHTVGAHAHAEPAAPPGLQPQPRRLFRAGRPRRLRHAREDGRRHRNGPDRPRHGRDPAGLRLPDPRLRSRARSGARRAGRASTMRDSTRSPASPTSSPSTCRSFPRPTTSWMPRRSRT